MLIHSDWHIHSEASYDATLSLEEIARNAAEFGFRKVGITDHLNFNDTKFKADLFRSAALVTDFQKKHPNFVLGVELTPIEKPEFDHIAKSGTREGYVAPLQATPYDIELACTKEELMKLGVRYAIGAAHWRVDVPKAARATEDINVEIREWHRQQIWLACDERVTILGHPWYHGRARWYEDFSVIPRSMNDELAAALKENGKFAECNVGVLCAPEADERFRRQYAEFLRELFEKGVPLTYGSDAHSRYVNDYLEAEKYLLAAGFADGDFSELPESVLW